MTDSLDAVVVTVKRWTRYGKDRMYVSHGERQLGHRDLQTGEVVCERPGDQDTVRTATAEAWRRAETTRYRPRHCADPVATVTPPATNPTPVATVTTAAVTPLLPDRDSAGTRPVRPSTPGRGNSGLRHRCGPASPGCSA